MTVTSAKVKYRVRIYNAGVQTTSATTDIALTLTQATGFTETPVLSGPSVRLLDGITTSHPFSIQAISDSVVFASSSRLRTLGRLALVQRQFSTATGTWNDVSQGRISGLREMEGPGRVSVDVSDERFAERRALIFKTTTTPQVYPPGLATGWRELAAAGTANFTVVDTDGNAVLVRPTVDGDYVGNTVPLAAREALVTDIVTNPGVGATSTGNFNSLRFDYNGSDWGVLAFRDILNFQQAAPGLPSGLMGDLSPAGGGGSLNWMWFTATGHGLSAGNTIDGRLYFPGGVKTSEGTPAHIGGESGIHPGTLLKNALDGTYGGRAMNYATDAMADVLALNVPNVWARVPGAEERSSWLTRSVYRPLNIAPLVGTDLVFRPTPMRLPTNVSATGLVTLTASNASTVQWEHDTRDLVTVVNWKSRLARFIDSFTEGTTVFPIDGQETVVWEPPEIEHDTVDVLGDVAYDVDTDLIWNNPGTFYGYDVNDQTFLARELFDIYGDGPLRGTITVADNAGVQVGDLVNIDHDSLQGYNPHTGDRTGDRIVRLITFRDLTPSNVTFEFLDMGPSAAVLSGPTITVTQQGSTNLVDVVLGSVATASGITAIAEVAVATSADTAFTATNTVLRRSGLGATTHLFDINGLYGATGAESVYGRAQNTKPHRIRSAWATDSDLLSTNARFDRFRVSKHGTDGYVSWIVPGGTKGLRLRWDIHRVDVPADYGHSADISATTAQPYTIANVPLRDVLTVQGVAYPSWSTATGLQVGASGQALSMDARHPRARPGVDIHKGPPRAQADFQRVAQATAGTFTLDVDDTPGTATSVEFQTRIGSRATATFGGWATSWTTSPTATETSIKTGAYTLSVGVPPGEESVTRWRIGYTDEYGTARYLGGTVPSTHVDESTKKVVLDHLRVQEVTPFNAYRTAQYLYADPNSSRFLRQSVTLPKGVTITQFRARMYSAASGSSSNTYALLRRVTASDAAVDISAQLDWTATGGPSWKSWSTGPVYQTASDESYQVELHLLATTGMQGTDARFYKAEITYTVPSVAQTL